LLLIATQWWQRGWHGADLAACGRAGVRGGNFCAWLLAASRHRQPIADNCRLIFRLFYLGFLPSQLVCGCVTSATLLAPDCAGVAAGQLQAGTHPGGLPAGGSH